MPEEAEMPAGRGELNPAFYKPIVRALRDGPRRVGDLLDLPEVEGRRDNPAELIGVLVGLEIAEPALRPGAEPGSAAIRFNRLAARRLSMTEPLGRGLGIASHRLGTGLFTSLGDLVVMERLMAGDTGLDEIMGALRDRTSQPERLREVVEHSLSVRMPLLRAAGVF
jgi:hypothetical protein